MEGRSVASDSDLLLVAQCARLHAYGFVGSHAVPATEPSAFCTGELRRLERALLPWKEHWDDLVVTFLRSALRADSTVVPASEQAAIMRAASTVIDDPEWEHEPLVVHARHLALSLARVAPYAHWVAQRLAATAQTADRWLLAGPFTGQAVGQRCSPAVVTAAFERFGAGSGFVVAPAPVARMLLEGTGAQSVEIDPGDVALVETAVRLHRDAVAGAGPLADLAAAVQAAALLN